MEILVPPIPGSCGMPGPCIRPAGVVERLLKMRSEKVVRSTIDKMAHGGEYRIPPAIGDPAIS
jgi:hypothetical protein